MADAQDMIIKIGFDLTDVPIIPAFGKHAKPQHMIMEEIEKRGAKLIVWEGFDMMVKNPNNPNEVGDFLSDVTAYCQDDDLTIIGTVGVAKLKPGEVYQNPRQLVGCSTIWERSTSTNFIIVPLNPKDIADVSRLLYVSLKNDQSFQLLGQFDSNGILVFDDYDRRDFAAKIAESLGEDHRRKR